ncbi:MAG: hypothetical protein PHQ43_11600 [Dehalococcoidales bacterium]|nr:hypothetical protein [Dehalococcoidales bacterium]
MTIRILDEGDPGVLYRHYTGQTEPQPAYIMLDCSVRTVWATYDPEIGGAVTSDVWHNLTRRYGIPLLRASSANVLMRELAPLLARVCEGFSVYWDGSNIIGKFNADASAAEDEIYSILQDEEPDLMVYDAEDWFFYSRDDLRAEIARRVRAGETGIAEDIEERQGTPDGTEDSPIINGIDSYLARLVQDVEADEIA